MLYSYAAGQATIYVHVQIIMPAYEEDIVLLDQLKAGSVPAFEQFYTQYRRYLMVLAISLLDNELEAQDVVQDFFIDFWHKQLYLKINPAGKANNFIRSYIHRIIYNRCMDKLEQRTQRQRRILHMPLQESTPSPEQKLQALEWEQELDKALKAAIKEIPPLSARVFELAYLQHKSRNEIAAELGISPHTVKNQLARAIRILRGRLKKVSF